MSLGGNSELAYKVVFQQLNQLPVTIFFKIVLIRYLPQVGVIPRFIGYIFLPHLDIKINPYSISIGFLLLGLDSLAFTNKFDYEDQLEGTKYLVNTVYCLVHTHWCISILLPGLINAQDKGHQYLINIISLSRSKFNPY